MLHEEVLVCCTQIYIFQGPTVCHHAWNWEIKKFNVFCNDFDVSDLWSIGDWKWEVSKQKLFNAEVAHDTMPILKRAYSLLIFFPLGGESQLPKIL